MCNSVPTISAGMPLSALNPIADDEADLVKVATTKKKSKFDWTYEEELAVVTSEASQLVPIVTVNAACDSSEDVTITHECQL